MKKTWRCFHCDDVFTREEDAAEHFGGDQGALAGCQIKGFEHNLLAKIREQEVFVLECMQEDSQLARAMQSMQVEHAEALRRAEELGYNRGVRDMNDQIAAAMV